MSYRNPEIIRDRSGEVLGQAIAGFGAQVAKGVDVLRANREKQRKIADAEAKRTQDIGYRIESKAYENRNKNYLKLKKEEPGVAEQFNVKTELLMRGDPDADPPIMGAIEANTMLATSPNLTNKEKTDLRAIVSKSTNFQTMMVGNAGKIISQTDILDKTSPGDFNSKYAWTGANQYEKDASQYASYAFQNKEIAGGRSVKKLENPGDEGSNVMSVTTYLDPNDEANKGKYDDEKMYPRNDKGEVVLEWKKNLNDEISLFEEIENAPDSVDIFNTSGITKDGKFNDDQYVTLTGSSTKIKGLEQYSEVSTQKIVNVAGWGNNIALQAIVKEKAAGFQGMNDQELSDFMRVKMSVGGFNVTEFRKLSTPEQELLIEKELNEEFIIQKTKNLSGRAPNPNEMQYAVQDPLSPVKLDSDGEPLLNDQGQEIPNLKIYEEKSKNIKGTPTAPALPENPNVAAQTLIDGFFDDPAQAYSTFKGGAGETAVFDEAQGEMRISGLVDGEGDPIDDEVYNFNDPNDIAKFAQILLESSKYVGGDAQGRKIKQAYTANMKKNIKTYLKKFQRASNKDVATNQSNTYNLD